MITFVYPTEANRDDVQRFYAEFEQQGKTCIGYGKHKNYDTWLTNVHNRIMATDLPEGFVQEAFYLCYDAWLTNVHNRITAYRPAGRLCAGSVLPVLRWL